MMNGGARIPPDSRGRLPAPPARRGDSLQCSPGVRYVSDRLTGRWLVSLIVSHQQHPTLARIEWQSWRLRRPAAGSRSGEASLTCTDENGQVLLSLAMRTDFPAPGVEMLLRDGCLFLPSEDWTAPRTSFHRLAVSPWRLATMLLRLRDEHAGSNVFPRAAGLMRGPPISRASPKEHTYDR